MGAPRPRWPGPGAKVSALLDAPAAPTPQTPLSKPAAWGSERKFTFDLTGAVLCSPPYLARGCTPRALRLSVLWTQRSSWVTFLLGEREE